VWKRPLPRHGMIKTAREVEIGVGTAQRITAAADQGVTD
jgi:hypothetical protein